MNLFWFFPTSGDGRYLGTTRGARPITPAYLGQIAAAIDELGYDGALLPTGRGCEDAWVTAATLVPATRRLRFLVAARPGLTSPGLAARMTSTFDRLSGGRLLINVVTGGDPEDLAGDGVHLGHDERYELTDEFLTAWRGLCCGERVDFQGRHLRVEGGAGTALVGDPGQVAERIRQYADLGLETFILSGFPHLDEAHRVAELLFPLLGKARRDDGSSLKGVVVADRRLPDAVDTVVAHP